MATPVVLAGPIYGAWIVCGQDGPGLVPDPAIDERVCVPDPNGAGIVVGKDDVIGVEKCPDQIIATGRDCDGVHRVRPIR